MSLILEVIWGHQKRHAMINFKQNGVRWVWDYNDSHAFHLLYRLCVADLWGHLKLPEVIKEHNVPFLAKCSYFMQNRVRYCKYFYAFSFKLNNYSFFIPFSEFIMLYLTSVEKKECKCCIGMCTVNLFCFLIKFQITILFSHHFSFYFITSFPFQFPHAYVSVCILKRWPSPIIFACNFCAYLKGDPLHPRTPNTFAFDKMILFPTRFSDFILL